MKYNESIIIREYLPTDKDAIMSLIKLNTPDFFAEEEANDLSKYLDEEIEQYYVLLVDGEIVGCGGINFAENGTIGVSVSAILYSILKVKSLMIPF